MAKLQQSKEIVPLETIERRIFVLRGHRVMLDRDLAGLYGVPTKALNQAVKRNLDRFPEDFRFKLTIEEAALLLASRSQSVTLNNRGQNVKYAPSVFTEHGAVMLANTLSSTTAVAASIQVVRAFVRLRQVIAANDSLARKIDALQRKVGKHDRELGAILATMRRLIEPSAAPPKRQIGFVASSRR